jgi:Flp pilus assembly protein TadD
MSRDERTLIQLLAFVHLRHGAPQRSESLYAALVAVDANDAEAAKGLAWARLEAGKAQAALDVLDGISGPAEPGAVVQLLRARAFAQLGRLEDARVSMRAFGALRAAERTGGAPS